MVFMPDKAPLVVLGFLGTGLLLGALGLVLLYALVKGKRTRVFQALGAGVVVGSLYASLLLAAAVASEERVLAPGELKYFCEVDCHLAYSVVSVRTAKSLGPTENAVTATGLYYVVTLRTWFDERTIARWRPRDLALKPDARIVAVVDGYGNYYLPSEAGQRAFEQVEGPTPPLSGALLPGDSYNTSLVFDLPADRPNFRLLVTADSAVTWLLIGHEGSFFHKKVFFRLT